MNAATGVAAGAMGVAGVAGAAGAAGTAGALRVRDENSGTRETLPALFAAGQCRIQLPYRGARSLRSRLHAMAHPVAIGEFHRSLAKRKF